LDQILGVEMRAAPVRTGERMHNQEFALPVERQERRERRMKTKEPVEVNDPAGLADGQARAGFAIGRIPVRRHCGQTVETTT
jgi:hypothetical protein